MKDIDEPERIAAKDKVYEIVKTTAEYMWQMEDGTLFESRRSGGRLQGAGGFQRHCAGWRVQSKHGVHFATWDWAYGHTGVCHGHYFMENYDELEQLLEAHGFLIYELLTPEEIQRDVIDRAGAELRAFEHVNYCLAVRK